MKMISNCYFFENQRQHWNHSFHKILAKTELNFSNQHTTAEEPIKGMSTKENNRWREGRKRSGVTQRNATNQRGIMKTVMSYAAVYGDINATFTNLTVITASSQRHRCAHNINATLHTKLHWYILITSNANYSVPSATNRTSWDTANNDRTAQWKYGTYAQCSVCTKQPLLT